MSNASEPSTITLAAVGQSLIKRDVLAVSCRESSLLVDRLKAADVAFTNLEGAIAGRYGGWPMKDKSVAALPPGVLDTLRSMGFGLLSLANNHASDLGPPGILSTIEEAISRGFTIAGTGADASKAGAAGVGTFAGKRVGLIAIDAGPWGEHVWASDAGPGRFARPGVNRLGVRRRLRLPRADVDRLVALLRAVGHEQRASTRVALGFQSAPPAGTVDFLGTLVEPGEHREELMIVDEADLARHEGIVAEASRSLDLLVVYLHNHHWPADWMQPPGWMRDVARRLLAAGGDVFLSHGAPVLQGIEVIGGKPAAYGLGNFIFHSANQKVRVAADVWRSGLFTFGFRDRQLCSLDVCAISLGDAEEHGNPQGNRDAPRLWRGAAASSFLEVWTSRGFLPADRWAIDDGTARLRLD